MFVSLLLSSRDLDFLGSTVGSSSYPLLDLMAHIFLAFLSLATLLESSALAMSSCAKNVIDFLTIARGLKTTERYAIVFLCH